MDGLADLTPVAEAPEKAEALGRLLDALADRGYAFTTPTPSTSRRMFEQPRSGPPSLRDIFGWSRPFAQTELEPELLDLLQRSGRLQSAEGSWKSGVRVSTVHGTLFAHSAFPATAEDAVFLGPDTYRFADLIERVLKTAPRPQRIFDIGAGAGVGGLVAGRYAPGAEITLSDINPAALALASVNALHAGVPAKLVQACGMSAADGAYDLIVANPPYVAGSSGRTYKDGGDMHGAALSLDWAGQAIARLAPGGRLVMYTGSSILRGGQDRFGEEVAKLAERHGHRLTYRELDPDVFSGELRRAAYDDVERIAAVAAVVQRAS